jgi:hypothetical protein
MNTASVPCTQGKYRQLTEDDVEFIVTAEEEDMAVKGSFSSALENAIIADFNSGNEWAWCCVKVVAKWEPTEDVSLQAETYLGGCSYKSKRDFLECNDYAKDMKAEVLAELNTKVAAYSKALELLTK